MPIKAIRGATTVNRNVKEDIESASIELFRAVKSENKLKDKDIISIQITTTADITKYYPATALRLNGCTAPLFSGLEPSIDGSIPLCVRMLILAKIKKPKHVYLKNATTLLNNKKEENQ